MGPSFGGTTIGSVAAGAPIQSVNRGEGPNRVSLKQARDASDHISLLSMR